MDAAFVARENYQLNVLSLPFVMAALGLMGMSLYVLLMRGSQLLRASFLLVCGGMMPVLVGYALVGSIRSTLPPEEAKPMAEFLYRLGFALAPTAAAFLAVFLIVLSQRLVRYRLLIGLALATSLVHAPIMIGTDWYIRGIWRSDLGFYHVHAGPAAPAVLIGIAIWIGIMVSLGLRWLRVERSPVRRRQLRGAMLACGSFVLWLFDALLIYDIGVYPVSWLSCTLCAFFALRSLMLDELIEVRALDQRAPHALLYLTAAAAGIWGVWQVTDISEETRQVINPGPPMEMPLPVRVAMLVFVYLVLRSVIILTRIFRQPAVSLSDTLLDRLLEQYASRVHSLHEEPEIGKLTNETVKLGLGCKRIDFFVPSAENLSWLTLDGQILSEEATPHPFIVTWMQQDSRPIVREDLSTRRLEDVRESIAELFAAHGADILVPLVSQEDVVGMLVIAELEEGRALTPEELRFLDRLQEYTAAALVYAHMHREANARVALHKEMELAAAVQSAFVPKGDLIDYGATKLSGMWAPASRCGGDWWWAHKLPDNRVLVLVGDVTGHGVAAAMVTAAAKGCYDVAQRLMGSELDLVKLLELLDASVRLVGGGSFHMTCFATLLDPSAGKVTYANAGHVVPYLCRILPDGTVDLGVLSARGTPLGAGTSASYQEVTRDIAPGDLLVWYTDGIVECLDRERNQFGDRRFQRLLRKLDKPDMPVREVRDQLLRAALAFQDGQNPDDDITLVVARIEAGLPDHRSQHEQPVNPRDAQNPHL